MPAVIRYPTVSAREGNLPMDLTPTTPSSEIIRSVVIVTVIFFIVVGLLVTWLLCFYRERHERCWLPELCCCGWARRPKLKLRSFRRGDAGYARNAEARRSRSYAATDPPIRLVASLREGTNIDPAYPTQQLSGRSYVLRSRELDARFVIGDDDDAYELNRLDNQKQRSSSIQPSRIESPKIPTMTQIETLDWPELPPRSSRSRLRKNKSTMGSFFSRPMRKTTTRTRRDSV